MNMIRLRAELETQPSEQEIDSCLFRFARILL